MDIFYKCECMAKEAKLTVPDRQPLGDLSQWLDAIRVCLHMDHSARSPLCLATASDYVKLPYDPDLGVGILPAVTH